MPHARLHPLHRLPRAHAEPALNRCLGKIEVIDADAAGDDIDRAAERWRGGT